MNHTIIIQVPTWVFLVFCGLFTAKGAMELYVWRLKRKIAALESLKEPTP